MPNKKQKLSGFTIVELLVVIVVIGILAAITIVSYTGISRRAIVASIQSDLANASQQLKIYQTINNAYPTLINDCPTPAAANVCLKTSNGNSFSSYTPNNGVNPQTFSLTSSNTNGDSYVITNDSAPAITMPVNLTFNNTSTGQTGTIQSWTVPATDTYTIDAWGAQGGNTAASGGLGAHIKGDVTLNSGDTVKILVGQQGLSYSTNGAGGGGGTFVIKGVNTPLIIAGGGGGAVVAIAGSPGQAGNNGSASSTNAGGTGGLGGAATYGGGGAGLTGNGAASYSPASVAMSFVNGGVGGVISGTGSNGGFGGGGACEWQSQGASGGGGGYSGGGGGPSQAFGGGGGGSYNAGTNQTNTAGARSGQGLVTIHN